MTAEERVANFTKALIASAPVWYDGLPLVFPGKDIKEGIKKTWITLHAEGKLKPPVDWKECRNLLNKTLTWQEPKNSDGFEKAVPVEIHPKALTGEERKKRIDEFLKAHLACTQAMTQKHDNFKEVREQWKSLDGEQYHQPSQEDLRMIDLKIQYGREHTNKYTGDPLEGHPTWEEFLKTQTEQK